MTSTTHIRFLRWLMLAVAGGCLLSVAFVVLVDPYGLYRLAEREGVNAVKPMPGRYHYQIKLANARRVQAPVLLLGNSRVEVGIDPESAALGGNAFNLGLAGTGIGTAVQQLRALREDGQRPRQIIAGMEFMDAVTPPAAAPRRAPAAAPPKSALAWQLDALFSLYSVKDALFTLAIQHNTEAEMQTARGFNPLRQYERYVRVEGYHRIFRQRAEESVRNARHLAHGGLDADGVRAGVSALLDAAAADNPGVEVHLVIYPYHAQMMTMIEQIGLRERFEAWKDVLIEQVAAARKRDPGLRIALHDFSGYGYFNCEPIPRAGSSDSTRWYWEAGHFKRALGDLLVRRIVAPQDVPAQLDEAGRAAWQDFGVTLTASTRAENTERIAAERAACAAHHPETFDSISKLLEKQQVAPSVAKDVAAEF